MTGRCSICGRRILWGALATPEEVAAGVCPDPRPGGCTAIAAELAPQRLAEERRAFRRSAHRWFLWARLREDRPRWLQAIIDARTPAPR